MGQPRFYTTQQVAKMLGVSVPTVVNWVKQGRLDAHKTPGGHRRISGEALQLFSTTYAYPLPGKEQEGSAAPVHRVLIVDRDPDFGEMVGEYLQLRGGYDVRIAVQSLEAGFFLGGFQPHLILLDLEHDLISSHDVWRLVTHHVQEQSIRMIGSATFLDSLSDQKIANQGLAGVVEKPVKLDELLTVVREVLG